MDNDENTGSSDNRPTFFGRFHLIILIIAIFVAPTVFYGSVRGLTRFANDVRQWLPRGFESAEKYDWFLAEFGGDELLVVSWDGCTVDDPRIDRLATHALAPNPDGKQYFHRAVTARQLIDKMSSGSFGLSRASARRRIQGLLIGPDKETSSLVLFVSPLGAAKRSKAITHLEHYAIDQMGIAPESLRFGGPTADGAAIERESKNALFLQSGIALIVVFGISWIRFRSLTLSVLVFGVAVFCSMISLAVVFFTGGMMNLTLVMLPALVFVLAVSAAVHLVNYFTSAEIDDPPRQADLAIRRGWLPCALAAGTTAVGLGSLGVSSVVPVKLFGLYSAAGVLLSLPVLLLLLPAILSQVRHRAPRKTTTDAEDRLLIRPQESRSTRFVNGVCRRHGRVLVAGLAVMLVVGLGIQWIDSTVKIQHRFSSKSRVIQDYAWLEENLGPLVPLEIVAQFPADSQMDMWSRLEQVKRAERVLRKMDEIGATMSAATFAPVVPRGSDFRATARRSTIKQKFAQSKQQLIDLNLIRDDSPEFKLNPDGEPAPSSQLWRISARLNALNQLDYGYFVEKVQQQINAEFAQENPAQVSFVYTGGIPLMYQAQRQILNDLVKSFVGALIVISVVMMIALRSVMAGLIAMIPNVFPTIVVFGGMGWSGYLVEIGTVMTASLALGIAVDDTFHFLTWYRRGFMSGLDRRESVRFAFAHCSRAMLDTTIVCSLGFMAFIFSTFMPTMRFAILLMVLMVAALVGDLIVLPSILSGPLGRFFQVKRVQEKQEPVTRRLPKVATKLSQTG